MSKNEHNNQATIGSKRRKGVKDKLTHAERCGIGIKGNRWEGMLINSLKVPNATEIQKMTKSPAD